MKYVDIDTAVEVFRGFFDGKYLDTLSDSFREELENRELVGVNKCEACEDIGEPRTGDPCNTCKCIGNGDVSHWRPKKGDNNG
jgi:hypothetical protein